MTKKLIFSILVLIPILGPILYLLFCNTANKREKVIALVSLIPAVNVICAIILIISALMK